MIQFRPCDRLKKRAKLAIISNVDRDLFEASSSMLGVDFDWVVTSGRCGGIQAVAAEFPDCVESDGGGKGGSVARGAEFVSRRGAGAGVGVGDGVGEPGGGEVYATQGREAGR